MAAGYSTKSLQEKLGVKENFKMTVINAPPHYFELLGQLPENVTVTSELKGPLDFVHFFTKERKELQQAFPALKRELSKDGILWISWPKIRSKVKTDLNEGFVREIGVQSGLVDVKVCAIDEMWSGLKFVFRLKDRK